MSVEIHNVTKSFKVGTEEVIALDRISLSIKEKEFLCLLGPSGCGKSTLLKLIAGIDQPDDGEILFDGQRVREPSKERGVVFQDYALFPWLTVRKNILFGLELAKVDPHKKKSILDEYLQLFELHEAADLYPNQLSGGMKQRVAIARALCLKPELLLLDEPFAALDPFLRQKLQDELLRIWNVEKITFILVTHDIEEAIYLADRIVVLTPKPGKINEVIPVHLPRPRSRTDSHFIEIRNRIIRLLNPQSTNDSEVTNKITISAGIP
jgi:nitrate ABC transporter ATP-binding subunit